MGVDNEKAFREFFHRWFRKLYFFTLKFIPDKSSAEEIAMDVLLNVWQKKHLLKSDLSFSSYLYRSVRNRITDHVRRQDDRVVSVDVLHTEPASAFITDSRLLYKELETIYRKGVQRLPPQKRLIFKMSREEGNSYQQIADKLRISKNTVENHMVAAIRLLRQHVRARVSPALILLLVFLTGAGAARAQMASPDNSFGYLRANFTSPGNHYGSAPLWVWNTKVTKTMIDSNLYAFKKNAFGGVFIHPRPGLITEYLSSEWFDDYAYAVKKGKELGLDVWIYDENSYPSGFAGGHVPDEMPESYNQGEMLKLLRVGMLPDTAEKYPYCLKKEDGAFRDITARVRDYAGKTGDYYLFSKAFYYRSPWYGGFSYVDLLAKGVTEKFIDVTMKGYEKSIGPEFGRTVRGIFSDEPNIEVQEKGCIRWTPDLFSAFTRRWGYDLVPHLPSLYEETGDWKKVRHDYYQTLCDLFVDRWSKPFAAYAEKQHLEWTGHYWEHEWPSPNHVPDNMAMYAWPQRPGIDMLFNQFNEVSPGAQFGNIRSVKELASVCNQMGKKRNLSETYGGGGWDLTFKDMKRLGDWEFVLGINTLNQHIADMTIEGARKYDYPQSFSYHNPWWPYYGSLNEHFTRLTFSLTRGEEKNDVLVLEPTTSAWMYFGYDEPDKRFASIGTGFQAFVTKLQKAQVEYDLGSEYIIREHGSVTAGKFIIGKRAYTTVVIPRGMENVDARTWELLRQFLAQGGKIVQLENLERLDGGDNKDLDAFNAKGGIKDIDEDKAAKMLQPNDLSLSVDGGDVFHQRRQLKDGQILFLANSDMVSPAKTKVRVRGKKVLLLNTFTGEIFAYPAKADKGWLSLDPVLPPAGSMLFFISNGNAEGFPAFAVEAKAGPIPAGTTTIMRPTRNTLMIDFCDVHIGDTVLKDKHVYYACDTVFKHFGFGDGNPWNTSVQFRRNIVDRDTFAVGRGFSVTYHFTIEGGWDARLLEAVVEHTAQWKIAVNGHVVSPEPGRWWLDKSFGVLKIGNYLQTGENNISLSTDRMSIYDEIEPLYILGDFNLVSAQKGWILSSPSPLQPGSWKTQGMPMYGQEVRYVKEVRFGARPKKLLVRLGKWNGTMAAVTVNGQAAGVIAYDPFELDITKYLVTGTNRIEVKVVGSLKNLLGPHHRNPRPGLASPWHWRGIRDYPAGKDYDTYDYGLMEDFQLVGSAGALK